MKSIVFTLQLVTAVLFINQSVGFDILDKKKCCLEKGGPIVQRIPCSNGIGYPGDAVYMEHKKCLVFIDKEHSNIIEYNIESGKSTKTPITDTATQLTGIVPVKNNKKCYVLTDKTCLYALCSKCGVNKGYNIKKIGPVLHDNNCSMKGAKATCNHNLMTASSNTNNTQGALWSVEIGMSLKVEKKCSKNTCGFAWNKDGSCFYAVHGDEIYEYQYNKDTESIGQGKCVFKMTNYKHFISGKPHAIVLDSKGHLWIGTCGTCAVVICFDMKKNEIIKKIALPSSCITTMTWGGKDYDILFVGTTNKGAKDLTAFVHGAGMFSICETGQCGFPANKVMVPKEKLPCAC